MKKLILTLIVLCLVTACTSAAEKREKFTAQLDTWKGASEEKLIEHFGVPDKHYELKGVKYLTYIKRQLGSYSGYEPGSPGFVYGGTGFYPHTGVGIGYSTGRRIDYYCEVTFVVKGGKVSSYTFEGNYCV